MALHEIPLERRTLHGHFARDLEPILTVEPGDSIAFSCLNAGWRTAEHERVSGPTGGRARRRARVDRPDRGPRRASRTDAGGRDRRGSDRLGRRHRGRRLVTRRSTIGSVSARARPSLSNGRSTRTRARSLGLRPRGRAPSVPRRHRDAARRARHPLHAPPRPCGGNIDCKELVAGTTLYLPIPVDGALLSAGDGHAAQGDGEVSQLAIEAPVERAQLTLSVRDDLPAHGADRVDARSLADLRVRRGPRRGCRARHRRRCSS